MNEEETISITPREIIRTIMEQIVLPGDGWENVLKKTESMIAVEWEITLDTELVEA